MEKYEAGQLTDEVADAARMAEYEAKVAALERQVGQLTMEVDLLKKSARWEHQASGENYSIVSGPQPSRSREDAESWSWRAPPIITAAVAPRRRNWPCPAGIAELSAEFPRYRRVTHPLHAEGLLINHQAVARIMRPSGLQVRPLRRFVRTTQRDHQSPIFPHLAQGFTPTGLDQMWVADLT